MQMMPTIQCNPISQSSRPVLIGLTPPQPRPVTSTNMIHLPPGSQSYRYGRERSGSRDPNASKSIDGWGKGARCFLIVSRSDSHPTIRFSLLWRVNFERRTTSPPSSTMSTYQSVEPSAIESTQPTWLARQLSRGLTGRQPDPDAEPRSSLSTPPATYQRSSRNGCSSASALSFPPPSANTTSAVKWDSEIARTHSPR